ncbi:MAG: peptidase domain-containing ABC transporter, partial [Eubacterium sp.]
ISVGSAWIAKLVIDAAVRGNMTELILFSVLMFLVILGRLVCRLLSQSMEVRIQAKMEINMKSILFKSILYKDYGSINTYHSGELMNRLTSDIKIVTEGITSIIPTAFYFIAQFIGAFALLIYFDKNFAIIVVVAGIMILFSTTFFRTMLKRMHKEVQATDGIVRSFMQEAIESLLVIKTFGIEDETDDKNGELQIINYNAKMKRRTVSIFANCGFGFIYNLGYLYSLVWSSINLLNNTITYGTLTAVLQLINQVQAPFANITKLIPQYYGVLASAERIIEIEEIKEEVALNDIDINTDDLYKEMKEIHFRNITFSYDRDVVLEGADLTIAKGDFVAIRGRTGIGKSTLIKMLLGVFQPTDGNISICCSDDYNIPIDKKIRGLFSYVPQGNMLFSGTIIDNLKMVNLKAEKSDINKALYVSCADEFVKELPYGLDTVIGEKGLGLSEGQIQRLAIARAVLSNAPIILLDEATSALDEMTEKQVLQRIMELSGKTCIIITHKQAALDICNKEVIIQNKKIECIEKK